MAIVAIIWAVVALYAVVCIAMHARKTRRAAAEQAALEAERAEREATKRQAAKRRADEKCAARAAADAARCRAAAEKRAAREQVAAEQHAVKVARAQELAELAERALRARQELDALNKQPAPEASEPVRREIIPAAPQPAALPPIKPQTNAPQSYAGEVVAFTGTLPTMTRAEAIEATRERGGQAHERINTHCTLLVVGEKPGKGQLDQAARWHVQTITWREWFERAEISYRRRMVGKAIADETVTMTPEEFAAAVAAM